MKTVSRLGTFLMLLCLMCLLPQISQAHRLDVHAWLEGNQIVIESGFGLDHPARNALIRIVDSDTGQVLAQGQTSNHGIFTFPVPKVIQQGHGLSIEIDAGQGHYTDWRIDAAELYAAASLTAGFDQDAIDAAREQNAGQNQTALDMSQPQGSYQIPSHENLAQMSQPAPVPTQSHPQAARNLPVPSDNPLASGRTGIIEKAMENQQHRAEIEGHSNYGSGPTIANVIGGLGWIIGLVGIFLYWRARKDLAKRREED